MQRNNIAFRPILLDKETLTHEVRENKDSYMEIIPWEPCIPAMLLQLWLEVQAAWHQKRHQQILQMQNEPDEQEH